MGLAQASSFTSEHAVIILICHFVTLILQSVTTNWGGIEEALDAPDLEEEEMILLDDELYVSENGVMSDDE